MDDEILNQYEEEFRKFLSGKTKTLHLPPMNSYQRRLLHQLALEFKFNTGSEGEGEDRHVVVSKTPESAAPEKKQTNRGPVWSYGDREFMVDSKRRSVWVYLAKDGSVGTLEPDTNTPLLTKKKITTGSFKVKNSRIVEIVDPEW